MIRMSRKPISIVIGAIVVFGLVFNFLFTNMPSSGIILTIPFVFLIIAVLGAYVFFKAVKQKSEHYSHQNQDNQTYSGIRPKECPKCKKTVAGHHNYCPHCGASMKDTIICEYCGHENPKENALCENCNGFL